MKLLHLLLLVCVCVALVSASTDPVFGESSRTTYSSRGSTIVFPPAPSSNEQSPYFADDLNFDAISGKILIGAADKLYVLNKDLNVADGGEYIWNSSRPCPQQDDRVCRNHIRIYQRRPASDGPSNSLFVCGTQSGVGPQCRLLNVSGSRLIQTGAPSPTDLISAHPDFPGFGDFRKGSASDNVYFAANFRGTDSMSYDISYQQVTFGPSGETVNTSRLYGWQQGDMYWLASPVVFVDFERINYAASPGQDDALLQYYFVFLREKQASQTDVLSRVLRLCRNDAGVNRTIDGYTPPADSSDQIFTSFMKATIFCEREMPPGTQFVGAQDFKYSEIWSVAFNDLAGGRFHEDRPYVRTVYGAFSGPRIGPIGSAICAYRADMGDPSSSDGLTGGIFDVFRDDVINPRTRQELENNYLECNPNGRSPMDSQRTDAVQDVRQIGENPLVTFEGFYITQMVVDQVCVVRRDRRSCVNQDILFLGTSDGRVLKTIFATDTSSGSNILPIFPIVAEEIQLDDSNPVKEMKIENVDSTKQLYVVTSSRIYRLPLERCSRHQKNYTKCIESRDPYCVWDNTQVACTASPLSAVGAQDGTVPVYIQQNIHTGTVQLPAVGFEQSSYSVAEGSSLPVTVISNASVPDGVVQLDINDLTAKVGVNVFSISNPINITLRAILGDNSSFGAMLEIETRRDEQFSGMGDLQFQLSLRNTIQGAVFFTQQNVTVTILDADGTLFRVGLGGLGSECLTWRAAYSDKATESLVSEIASAIGGNYPKTNIFNTNFNCDKIDDGYITFTGALLATDAQSVPQLRQSVEKWASEGPKVTVGSTVVIVDSECSVRISSLNSTCQKREVGSLSPNAGASSVNAAAIALAVLLAIFILITLILVVVIVVLMKLKKENVNCPPNDMANKVVPEGSDFYNEIERSTEVPPPITHSGGSAGAGLAGRRGSKDLELHFKPPQFQTMISETNPRSSDPLLGRKFFTESDEVDPSSVNHYVNDGASENHESSNGIVSADVNEKIDLSTCETSGPHVSEQPV